MTEAYGGKYHKKSEETREKFLREKRKVIVLFSTVSSVFIWLLCFAYLGFKNSSVQSWNDDVIAKTRTAWKAMDKIEEDVMNSVLFLKGCRRDIVFQETPDGFELQIVEFRNQSMEVLQDVPEYNDQAVPAFLGSGIRPGDALIFCNQEEEKKVKLQVIRNNPKFNFDYLIFPEKISLMNSKLPSNLIKFITIRYRWEKQADGTEKLFRQYLGQEKEVLSQVRSRKIDYSFKDSGNSFFTIDLTLQQSFKNNNPIQIRRIMPLESFQRLPRELEWRVP